MWQRIIRFCIVYILFLLIFMFQKPLFVWLYHNLLPDASFADIVAVMHHGMMLDCSIAGYLTLIPGILLITSVWCSGKWLRITARIYYIVVAWLLAVIFIANVALYGYWGFPLDATPIFYLTSSPADAMASVSAWTVIGALLLCLIYAGIIFLLFMITARKPLPDIRHKWGDTAILSLMVVLLFIPIRGGFTVSTMNTGKAYFSNNRVLNHAAVNPVFSLLESISRQKDFASQYRFMTESEAKRLVIPMLDPEVTGSVTPKGSITRLFKSDRPDIIMIILESFSSHLMKETGGNPNIAMNLDSLSREGILFTGMYANSFRTDRGLVSILSGYPAQPNTSIMKYPRKTQSLPSIAGALRKAGYKAHYYYGGDADFTNMRSYLVSSGFQSIMSDTDFPLSQRLSKWGVHDHLLFRRVTEEIEKDKSASPQFKVIQTSSSHEPFEVPYSRLDNARLNAFAYTDSCVGAFVRELKQSPKWKNTVVILVPDHLGAYPENIDNLTEARYKIPMILIGGAVNGGQRVATIGSQQDIAATLLSQLGIDHSQFYFSKDMMNTKAPHFAFFSVPDAMGMVNETGMVIYDNETGKITESRGDTTSLLPKVKAYLQTLYDDLAKR